MILVSSGSEAKENQRTVNVLDQPYGVRDCIGAAPTRGVYVEGNETNDNSLPQGFFVLQPPESVTPPHFHECDQFQVFVSGNARVGKKSADPLTVQFAGAHTPYGPITAGENGVQYFTLRKRWDPGAKYMPQMKDRLIRGHQRQRIAAVDSNEIDSRDQQLLPLIGPEDDGLFAALLTLAPHAAMAVPEPSDGDGQYHVVIDGSMIYDDQELPLLSCQFCYPDESRVSVNAGSLGLSLLVLRFPHEGPEHPSRTHKL